MRSIIHILTVVPFVLFVGACINNKVNVDLEGGMDRAFHSISLIGKYEGNLPCADCTAIATTLILRQDHTYSLHYMYVGKSDEQFHKTGNWKVDSDILQLDNEDYDYKVVGNKLNQLDLSGKEMKGNLAGKYVLSKVVSGQ